MKKRTRLWFFVMIPILFYAFLLTPKQAGAASDVTWYGSCSVPDSNYRYGYGNATKTSWQPYFGYSTKSGKEPTEIVYSFRYHDYYYSSGKKHEADDINRKITNNDTILYDSSYWGTSKSKNYWSMYAIVDMTRNVYLSQTRYYYGEVEEILPYAKSGSFKLKSDYVAIAIHGAREVNKHPDLEVGDKVRVEITEEGGATVTEPCDKNLQTSSISADKGTVSHRVKYYSSGVSSSYQTHYTYFVNDVNVRVTDSKTKQGEPLPEFSCVKTYGNGATRDCTSSLSLSKDSGGKTTREVCYTYKENGYSDEACTTRVYVKSVEISGPSTSYTGERNTYTCRATFYDDSSLNITNKTDPSTGKNDIWSSSPYNYIGEDWAKKGYRSPDGVKHTSGGANVFYPVDPDSRTYTITCQYYPGSYKQYENKWLKDGSGTVKKDTLSVQHVGIKSLQLTTNGGFLSTGNQYTNKTVSLNSNDVWSSVDFITGNWYDFKATATFDDDTVKNVTTAPEVYWEQSGEYPVQKSYHTNMPESGLDHRIPEDGYNNITVRYFHDNIPYGTPDYGQTKRTGTLWAHQLADIEIRNENGKAPKTVVKTDEQVQYSAYVVWSDNGKNPFGRNAKEDWTNVVNWGGEFSLGKGLFEFKRAGHNEKATVTASFQDTAEILRDSGYSHWDELYHQIEVTIDDCSSVDHLASGCPIPADYWRTNPSVGFSITYPSKSTITMPNHNWLPPADVFGYASWSNDNNPYYFEKQFSVSGMSTGVGNK
ncbi:hypothetical protein IMZ31_19910 (plasmid) [Pontibacillus sp. ALD_SL1]|uniref:hypothetical protein n=1 Tax=Pontibacillus sp. ALD_SL1 TaxID=2777185 RepID=UPI001A971745|nr:hypothetical protein [Pontibacillus sp. ALD_SL1]QST02818.1 hypothetical protein IMZ31_19910 [Pontibacillus sp. ALD_SL1]